MGVGGIYAREASVREHVGRVATPLEWGMMSVMTFG